MQNEPFSCYESDMVSLERARALMLSSLDSTTLNRVSDCLSLKLAFNRVLAHDIVAKLDVPSFDNSAMDGYAVSSADFLRTKTFKCVATVLAGDTCTTSIHSGECVRLMTGAPLPSSLDCVVVQEDATVDGEYVTFSEAKPSGTNVRKQGENIAQGSRVLSQGTKLGPAELGLLASLGESEVEVLAKVKVGLISTGDELKEPNEKLQPGQIYDSNRYLLHGFLEQLNCQVKDYGIIKDDKDLIEHIFEQADQECDLVICSGGVSVGEADYVRDLVTKIGNVGFWKVAIKPGKPFAFGHLKHAYFCGLPGNPVSSYVTFQQLVMPFIITIQGSQPPNALVLNATANTEMSNSSGRKDFQRATYTSDSNGRLFVTNHRPQGSNILSSFVEANCYVILDSEQKQVTKGDRVSIIPFCNYSF